VDNKQFSPGESVLLASGVLGLVASFLPWLDAFGVTRSSWSGDALFPVSWFVPMSAVVAAVLLAVSKFTAAKLPADVVGYTPEQLRKMFAVMGALLAIGWVIAIENAGIGFWLSVVATFGAVAGVFMIERTPAGSTGTAPY
jgi:hypothetical protein